MDNRTTYPNHLIDPAQKNKEWIAKYIKAAWNEFSGRAVDSLYNKRFTYEVIRAYAQGRQDTSVYKKRFDIDASDDKSLLNINFTPIPIYPKIKNLALGRLNKVDYNVMATPIDSLASSETEDYFETQKAKLVIREQLEKISPELAELSPVAKSPGDPEDMEELELQRNYTHKHQMSIEMEQGITVVLEQNKFKEIRALVKGDLFDWGIGGFKEWIDSNGAIKIRKVDPRRLIVSHCQDPQFKDALHIGEVIEMSIADLKQLAGNQISKEEYEKIAEIASGKNGNARYMPGITPFGDWVNSMKVRVLDMEFFSINESVYEKTKTRYGNYVMSRASYDKSGETKRGEYKRVAYKVVYKGMWVIDTNTFFNCGLCTDMKRQKSSLMDTSMSFHLASSDFHEMRMMGTTERAIPVIDQLHLAWYKLQQAIAEAKPRGIAIELSALEGVNLAGKGGKRMTEMDVLDLYGKKGTLIWRRTDVNGEATNYRPIEELNNGIGDEAARWFDMIQANIQMLRDITGLNELTDGSTPDPRTLTTIAQMANESTNNNLWPIVEADNRMFQSLCESIVLRIQDVLKVNPDAYNLSLGSDTSKFVRVSPAVSNHEYGIKLENIPNDLDREKLMARMEPYIRDGLLRFEDTILIQHTDNIKVAEQILAYRIKKREEQRQQESIALQQANAQAQIASAAAAEEEKRKTLQLEYQLKMQLEQMKKEFDLQIKQVDAEARLGTQHLAGEAKLATEMMKSE